MKKTIIIILSALVIVCGAIAVVPSLIPKKAALPGETDINKVNFTDEAFRSYIIDNCDVSPKDCILSKNEIKAVKTMYVSESEIEDLKGIEYFTSLTSLNCGYNKLSRLDVSNNKNLKELNCDDSTSVKGFEN